MSPVQINAFFLHLLITYYPDFSHKSASHLWIYSCLQTLVLYHLLKQWWANVNINLYEDVLFSKISLTSDIMWEICGRGINERFSCRFCELTRCDEMKTSSRNQIPRYSFLFCPIFQPPFLYPAAISRRFPTSLGEYWSWSGLMSDCSLVIASSPRQGDGTKLLENKWSFNVSETFEKTDPIWLSSSHHYLNGGTPSVPVCSCQLTIWMFSKWKQLWFKIQSVDQHLQVCLKKK